MTEEHKIELSKLEKEFIEKVKLYEKHRRLVSEHKKKLHSILFSVNRKLMLPLKEYKIEGYFLFKELKYARDKVVSFVKKLNVNPSKLSKVSEVREVLTFSYDEEKLLKVILEKKLFYLLELDKYKLKQFLTENYNCDTIRDVVKTTKENRVYVKYFEAIEKKQSDYDIDV